MLNTDTSENIGHITALWQSSLDIEANSLTSATAWAWVLPFAGCCGLAFMQGMLVLVCFYEFSRYKISNTTTMLIYFGILPSLLTVASLATWLSCVAWHRMKRVAVLHILIMIIPWAAVAVEVWTDPAQISEKLVMWDYRLDWVITTCIWCGLLGAPALVKGTSHKQASQLITQKELSRFSGERSDTKQSSKLIRWMQRYG